MDCGAIPEGDKNGRDLLVVRWNNDFLEILKFKIFAHFFGKRSEKFKVSITQQQQPIHRLFFLAAAVESPSLSS